MSEDLRPLRDQLDDLDARLVDVLAARQRIVAEIARAKLASGAFRDLAREEDLLGRLSEKARGEGLDGYFVTRLFREILDYSLRAQQEVLADQANPARQAERTIAVAYQGTEGSYSYLAARRHFATRNADVQLRGYDTFQEILDAVQDRSADYAMLPIENTTAGSINEAYDLLARTSLSLVGEEVQEVRHCLLALEDVPLSRIRRVYSHPKALDQCGDFLRTLAHCQIEAFTDTAMAARKIRDDQDLSQAAIASEDAARLFGLAVLKRDIANQKENFTRFVVVAREPMRVDPRVPCKTSIIIATRHEEGALLGCLTVLHQHQLNLTKLESRPRPNAPWEYLFYIDFEGNVADQRVADALRALTAKTSLLKVLGSYPARTTRDARPAEPRRTAAGDAVAVEPPEPAEAPSLPVAEKKGYTLASRATRAADTVVEVGHVVIGGARPIVIAGPCSVESREQIMACARLAKEAGAHLLRGGCFKPRTSPYAFQGLAYEGLDLLEEAGRTYGLPIITEVMHPADIEPVARKADVLQLGARNMQNFSLLKEVGRCHRPVMLKRGLMASIDEWLAAAEYILAHGNQQVILCERGIRTFETATRNTLDLSAVPVVRELTHLPVIVDPSHACGVRRWVPAMAVAALAAGAQGIMVEFHPDPATALSDGPQALTFDDFRRLMQRVHAL